MRSLALSLALALAPSFLAPVPARAQVYAITDLQAGTIFTDALAYGISPGGMITGAGTIAATGEIHAFIRDTDGLIHDLGTLGYPYGADGVAINDSAQLAATGYGPGFQALLYSGGTVHTLGGLSGGLSQGLAINSAGHIVGRALNGDGAWQGFAYSSTLAPITPLNVDIARDINDADQIVGSFAYTWTFGGLSHEVPHAFIMSGQTLTDLGDLGGGPRTSTEAFGVSSTGDATGYSTLADGTVHAFKWSRGVMTDLGTFLPFYTYGQRINTRGDVLGSIQTYTGAQVGVFLHRDGVLRDFSTLLDSTGTGWSNLAALDMNDNGWIVGYGTIGGVTHGFLAVPHTGCTADFNNTSGVTIQDIFDFLTAWFALDPRADVNHSGSVTIQDVFAYLSAWFTGC